MAKKRRGRPPGSKNKSTSAKHGKSVDAMNLGQLRDHISQLEATLAAKIQQQREHLQGELEGLQIYANNKARAAVRAVTRLPKAKQRTKPEPKYQSKKNRSLKWTGRGMVPTWMREEMRGTKLTKEDFLIK
jgi:DNA-binding protein H-NS